MRAGILLGLLVFVTFSGCITDPVPEAMEYLAGELPDQDLSGRIHILSAAVATGQGLRTWPSTENPVGDGLTMPEGYGDRLRMLHALGTAEAPRDAWASLEEAAWDGFDGTQFGSDGSLMDDALAVAALMAVDTDPDDARIQGVVSMLRDQQSSDGGWNWNGQYQTASTAIDTTIQGEPDETAFVLRALGMADALDEDTRNAAVRFLDAIMHTDGSYDHGGTVNCQSTGLALLAWSYVGAEPSPLVREAVASCQNPDGGFPYLKDGPSQVWATAEIVQGLAVWS